MVVPAGNSSSRRLRRCSSQTRQRRPAHSRNRSQLRKLPVDPEEEKAYKAFTDVKPDAFDQQIQVGEQYLQKYPTGHYSEQVYARLTNAYFQKQQFDKMYAAAIKPLPAIRTTSAVLVLVGWVIPHNYDPNDPEARTPFGKSGNL